MAAVAVLVAPFVLAWGVYLVLRWQAAASLSRTLGADADPARLARQAEILATSRMNQWSGTLSGFLLLLWLTALIPVCWTAFTAPISRRDTVRTKRLTLRRARAEDLEDFHAIYGDEETLRYWDSPPHESIAETEVWLGHLLSQSPDHGDMFVIERRGRVVGLIGIWGWPWLNFVLARDEWGKGYAVEAMTAFLRYIFDRGLLLVTASTDQRNQASQKLLRKCGFREYQRGDGRHSAKDEAYAFVAMRRDRPSWSATLRRLRFAPRGTVETEPAAPLWT